MKNMTPAEAAKYIIESPDRIVSIVVSHHEKPHPYRDAVKHHLTRKYKIKVKMGYEQPIIQGANTLYVVKTEMKG